MASAMTREILDADSIVGSEELQRAQNFIQIKKIMILLQQLICVYGLPPRLATGLPGV
jgi:hypothetical protein